MATTQFDDAFYERADAHINLSNDQINRGDQTEMVNASMMFAAARFCAWVSARGFGSAEAMQAGKQEISDYFMDGFKQMLEGNLDAYIRNFDAYMKAPQQ